MIGTIFCKTLFKTLKKSNYVCSLVGFPGLESGALKSPASCWKKDNFFLPIISMFCERLSDSWPRIHSTRWRCEGQDLGPKLQPWGSGGCPWAQGQSSPAHRGRDGSKPPVEQVGVTTTRSGWPITRNFLFCFLFKRSHFIFPGGTKTIIYILKAITLLRDFYFSLSPVPHLSLRPLKGFLGWQNVVLNKKLSFIEKSVSHQTRPQLPDKLPSAIPSVTSVQEIGEPSNFEQIWPRVVYRS